MVGSQAAEARHPAGERPRFSLAQLGWQIQKGSGLLGLDHFRALDLPLTFIPISEEWPFSWGVLPSEGLLRTPPTDRTER